MSPKSPSPFPLHGRYADGNRWEVLNGPGDARPTAMQIIKDEGLLLASDQGDNNNSNAAKGMNSLVDKVIFVTGASSGMGPHMVRALAATGATIYVGARDVEKAKRAIGDDLVVAGSDSNSSSSSSGQVHILHLDQADLSSVRRCADEFMALSTAVSHTNRPQLNILINNAAVMRTPEHVRTKDGHELQFQTNHLSHFLLFWLLRDVLLDSASQEFPSRVVSSTSAGHKYTQIDLDDLNLEQEGAYAPWRAYGQSKIANIYMTSHITRLYGDRNLYGFSATPGSFMSPNLQQHCTAEEMRMWQEDPRLRVFHASYEQACATAVYGAVAKEPLEYVRRQNAGRGPGGGTGLYLDGCSVAGPVPEDAVDLLEFGYAEWAFDPEKEARLWELSKKLVGVE
ncbi:uncharacterized protein B0I36DRAFT_300704 [Microdochium trichocladiopsis]|uniref:Short-chain dehydrogenase n=1 Tax=Microdochium trichocladiopsis TaxID=1682393 RepID=A0A9P8XP92_9PEZI|nr:uncharacterized protein B0I36DRAFT_300704 [Microdochium trichocladiopsis]KAH7007924.1 hypothetical protein B0I36DRAFT_300704 [Microdochium trichocladiopsis]